MDTAPTTVTSTEEMGTGKCFNNWTSDFRNRILHWKVQLSVTVPVENSGAPATLSELNQIEVTSGEKTDASKDAEIPGSMKMSTRIIVKRNLLDHSKLSL